MSKLREQLDALKEERQSIVGAQSKLTELIQKEAPEGEAYRAFKDDEQKQFDDLQEKFEQLTKSIAQCEKLYKVEKTMKSMEALGGSPIQDTDPDVQKASKVFNIAKFVREAANNGSNLDGVEREVHQEGLREAREAGLETKGAIIPGSMIRFSPKFKGINVEASPTNGGENVVGEDRRGIVPVLSIDPIVAQLGVTLFPNQKDDLYFVIGSKDAESSFVTEIQTAPESDIELTATAWKPIRNTTKQMISGRTLMQDTVGVRNYITERLSAAMSRSVDAGVIYGTGSGQLTGVTVQSGVNDVVGGTNGATLTRTHILNLITKLYLANSTKQNVKYLSNYEVVEYLKLLAMDAGSGRFVYPDMGDIVNGYQFAASNHVPNDLTKGTSTSICHALIAGDWSQYYLTQFGGVSIMVDEITSWDTDEVKIGIKSYWDGKAVQPACFSVMKDALLT